MPLPQFQPVDTFGMPLGDPGTADITRAATNAGLSTVLASIAPDPTLPGVAGYIPFTGGVEGVTGAIGALGKYGSVLANAALNRWGLSVPSPPQVLTDIGNRYERSREEIEGGIGKYTGGVLPQPDLTTPEGQVADIVGGAVGGGVGFTPGGIINALPRGLRTIGALAMPSLEHAGVTIPLSTVGGTTQGLAAMIAQQQQQGQPSTPAPAPTSPYDVFAPDTTQAQPPPPTDARSLLFSNAEAAPLPTGLSRDQLFTPQPAPTPSPDGRDTLFAPPAGPTFTQQGETGMPVWQAAIGLVTGLGLIAAGRYTHTLGTDVGTAERDIRFQDPDYAARAQQYTNDVIARGPGGPLTPPGGVQTPAPMPQGNVFHQAVINAATKMTNDAAKVQDVIHLTAGDPTTDERLYAMAGHMNDPQYQRNRTSNFLLTGHDPVTGITTPSIVDLLNDRAALPQDKATILAEGLKSADELDTRKINERVWRQANPGADPSLEDIAHNLAGKGSDELRAAVAKMQADPQLAEMATRYKAITDGMIDTGAHPAYGFFSPSEANDLKTQRPNYVPEMDINMRPMHPFGPRDTSAFTGQAQIMTDPVRDLAQHVEQLYPQFYRNQFNQVLREQLLDAQRSPGAAQALTDVQAPTGAHASYYPQGGLPEVGGQARDPIIAVRTSSGVKYTRNDDPITYGAMRNHSLSAAKIQLGAGQTARRVFQQFTTGVGSTLTSRLVPLRTAIGTTFVAPLTTPRNMRAGMFDYALQRMSPGGVPNRGLQSFARGLDMITNPIGTAYSYAKGFDERNYGNFARLFAPGADNPANTWLRSLAGDPAIDWMHKMADARWQASTSKLIRERGIEGAGSSLQLDDPGFVSGARGGPRGDQTEGIRSIAANLAPRAYFSADWKGSKPFFINLRNAVGDALNHISDAGLEYSARLNRDNLNVGPEMQSYAIRGLYGNPARHGSSPGLNWVTGKLPWANVGMQEIASVASAIGRRPFGSAVTMATGLGSLALLEILTHMRSQQHMDFLQNNISEQQREANVILGLNSDPTKPTMLPLPRSLRAPYAFMLDVMSKVVNTVAAYHDPISFNGVWEGLKDFFGSHITTSDAEAMQHGGVDMFDFVNPPPYMGHMDWNAAIQNGLANLPSAYHGVSAGPVDKTMPGQAPDSILDMKSAELFRNVLTNTFGAAAATLWNTPASVDRYMHQGHSFWDSMGMAGKDWLQQGRESNMSMNNLLFETPMRLSKLPPIAEALEPTIVALKGLPPMEKAGQAGFVMPGRNQLPVPVTGEPPIANDPMIVHMLQVTHGYAQRINQAMAPINAIKQQMGAVDKYGMDPQTKRAWLNQSTRNMADRYKLVQAYTDDMYNALSKYAGRPITSLGQIDWSKGMSQFQR